MTRLTWLVLAGLGLSEVVYAGLLVPGAPTASVFWLSFVFAAACAVPVRYQVTIRSYERMDKPTGRDLWHELPRPLRIVFGALFVATLANIATNLSGGPDDLDSRQTFNAIGVWIAGGMAVYAYSYERYLMRDQPLTSSRVGLGPALVLALSTALVVALVDLLVAT